MNILLNCSSTNKKWILHKPDKQLEYLFTHTYSISPILSTILVNRNIDITNAAEYINPKLKTLMPDPKILLNMDKACQVIYKHLVEKNTITILGDYDVDGITSTAILFKYLSKLSNKIEHYIPNRYTEGYGISLKALEKINKLHAPKLLILLDNGSVSYEEINIAKSMGMDVIVIDHHNTDLIPLNADAFINPSQLNDTSNLNYLCTVGLVFLFIIELNSYMKNKNFINHNIDLLKYLPFVALGTVCDMVPLIGINRAFVKQGVSILNKLNKTYVIDDLTPISCMFKALNIYHEISIATLGFQIGPCINASSRMGKSDLALKLLLCTEENEALQIAIELAKLNEQRKNEEEAIIQSAIFNIKQNPHLYLNQEIIFIGSEDYLSGIIGIIAGRIKEIYGKPTCVYSVCKDTSIATASGRSIPYIHLGSVVQAAKQAGLLVKGGGHAQAAGFSFKLDNIDNIKKYFCKKISKQKTTNINHKNDICLMIDLEIELFQINPILVNQLNELAPFGIHFQEPKFLLKNVSLSKVTIVGNNKNNISMLIKNKYKQYLKAFCPKCLPGILGETIIQNADKNVDLIISLNNNLYQGKITCNAIIHDINVN